MNEHVYRMKKKARILVSMPKFPAMFSELKRRKVKGEQIALLLGTPTHDNLGDHILAEAAKKYIGTILPELPLYEFTMEGFIVYGEVLSRILGPQDIVFINGGGWLGSVWESDDWLMQSMLRKFRRQHIVMLPQTGYYKEGGKSSRLMLLVKTVNDTESICASFREKASFDLIGGGICRDSNHHVFLLPDIALLHQPGSYMVSEKNTDILLCIREDVESMQDGNELEDLVYRMKTKRLSCVKGSTITGHRIIPLWRRNYQINKNMRVFSEAKLVITDRLHGMIFACLAGTPCIALDNLTGKVKGVYDLWIRNRFPVKMVKSFSDISDSLINEMMKQESPKETNYIDLYSGLTEIIRGWVNR